MDKQKLFELEQTYVFRTYRRQPVVFTRGEGCYLFDSEGKRYLDLVAGVAVVALGHSHPQWIEAIKEQAEKLVQVSNLYYTAPMIELAKELCEISRMDRVFFCNSGTEANEAAIKVARKWGKAARGDHCHRILTFSRAFHGRTLGALSATAQKNYCEPFEPLLPGFLQLSPRDIEKVDSVLDASFCGVMIEPVQGEGGVWPVESAFLVGLRKICTEKKILLIVDEVQTGIARTGKWFGFQHADILPDLAPIAKGLGGGFPIGACLARGEAASTLTFGDHGSTFAGAPLAASAAKAVLRVIQEENLVENAQKMGGIFREKLVELAAKHPLIVDVRGLGLMIGVELKEPVAKSLVSKALGEGLIINATGESTLRLIPPLILRKNHVEEAVRILDKVLTPPARP